MPLLEIVHIPVAPDGAAVLADVVCDEAHGYLVLPHCLRYEVFQSVAEDQVVVVILWASGESHEKASNSDVARAFFDLVMTRANGVPRIESFVSVSDPIH